MLWFFFRRQPPSCNDGIWDVFSGFNVTLKFNYKIKLILFISLFLSLPTGHKNADVIEEVQMRVF